MKKTKTVQTGDTIKLKSAHVKELHDRSAAMQALSSMVEYLSGSIREKNKLFWDFIYEVHPEAKDFNLSYDKGIILVKTRKEENNVI